MQLPSPVPATAMAKVTLPRDHSHRPRSPGSTGFSSYALEKQYTALSSATRPLHPKKGQSLRTKQWKQQFFKDPWKVWGLPLGRRASQAAEVRMWPLISDHSLWRRLKHTDWVKGLHHREAPALRLLPGSQERRQMLAWYSNQLPCG